MYTFLGRMSGLFLSYSDLPFVQKSFYDRYFKGGVYTIRKENYRKIAKFIVKKSTRVILYFITILIIQNF